MHTQSTCREPQPFIYPTPPAVSACVCARVCRLSDQVKETSETMQLPAAMPTMYFKCFPISYLDYL